MIAAAARPAAAVCLVGALILALRRGPRRAGDVGVPRVRAPGLPVRLAQRYDHSAAGRRLASQLWAAQLSFSPCAWRGAQVFIGIPLVTALLAVGASALAAVGIAASVSRLGGSMLLWARRHRCRHAIDEAAPLLARALAGELAAWGNGGQAVTAAATRVRSSSVRGAPVGADVLDRAALRVALGADAARSLRTALHVAAPAAVPPTSPALQVAALFALHMHDAAATSAALDRFAGTLDDDRAVQRQAHAAVGEVRMSTLAVPAIAAVTGALLLSADPPALAAALRPPLLAILAAAAAVVALAVAATRRLLRL